MSQLGLYLDDRFREGKAILLGDVLSRAASACRLLGAERWASLLLVRALSGLVAAMNDIFMDRFQYATWKFKRAIPDDPGGLVAEFAAFLDSSGRDPAAAPAAGLDDGACAKALELLAGRGAVDRSVRSLLWLGLACLAAAFACAGLSVWLLLGDRTGWPFLACVISYFAGCIAAAVLLRLRLEALAWLALLLGCAAAEERNRRGTGPGRTQA